MKIEVFENKESRGILRRFSTFEVLTVKDEQGNIISVYSSGKKFDRDDSREESEK